jgi:hypothetical protein
MNASPANRISSQYTTGGSLPAAATYATTVGRNGDVLRAVGDSRNRLQWIARNGAQPSAKQRHQSLRIEALAQKLRNIRPRHFLAPMFQHLRGVKLGQNRFFPGFSRVRLGQADSEPRRSEAEE